MKAAAAPRALPGPRLAAAGRGEVFGEPRPSETRGLPDAAEAPEGAAAKLSGLRSSSAGSPITRQNVSRDTAMISTCAPPTS